MKVTVRSVVEENLKLVVVLQDIHPALREMFPGATLENSSAFEAEKIIHTCLKEHYDSESAEYTISGDKVVIAFHVEDASDVGAAATAVTCIYRELNGKIEELIAKLNNYPELFEEYLRAKLSNINLDVEKRIGQG